MSITRYLWDAFKVPWNLLAIGVFLLGALSGLGHMPEGEYYWLAGGILEAAYLLTLIAMPRFRGISDARHAVAESRAREERILMSLKGDAQRSYRELKRACERMLAHLGQIAPAMVAVQRDELANLAGVYLQLLVTREGILKMLDSIAVDIPLPLQIEKVDARLADPSLTPDVRASFQAQRDILHERQTTQAQANQRLAFVSAELDRIYQQVQLLGEQAVVTASPESLARRITDITATLNGTSRWMSQQRDLIGAAADNAPPPVVLETPAVRQ